MRKVLLSVLAFFALTAATCQDNATVLYSACRSYVAAERVLIMRYSDGKLSEENWAKVKSFGAEARAICTAPVGDPVTPDMLATLEHLLLKLNGLKGEEA